MEDISKPASDTLPQIIIGIAADLRQVIDQLDRDFQKAKDLIIEISRRLDEGKFCERDCICRKLKELLQDKIKEGKISERWIEDCLPKEYKRKYSSKSEVSSLSKQGGIKGATILTTTHAQDDADMVKKLDLQEYKLIENNQVQRSFTDDKYDALINQNIELENAVQKLTTMQTADKMFTEEIDFTVSREKYEQLYLAMQNSKYVMHLVFDKNGVLIRAESDL